MRKRCIWLFCYALQLILKPLRYVASVFVLHCIAHWHQQHHWHLQHQHHVLKKHDVDVEDVSIVFDYAIRRICRGTAGS